MYRMAGAVSLLDAKIRAVGPDQALGGRGWDNYSWHTDLPPGHTMVTGTQTVEFDLHSVEQSKLIARVGHELDHDEMPDAGSPRRDSRARRSSSSLADAAQAAHKGRRGPRGAPRHDAGARARHVQCHHAREAVRRGVREAASPTCPPLLVRLDTLKLPGRRSPGAGPMAPLSNFTRVLAPK